MKILGAECYGIVMPKSWNKPNSPESTRGVINRKALYTILRSPNGNRYTLYFYWNAVNRKWNWNYNWLDNDRNVNNPSACLATLFISLPNFDWESFACRS